MVHRLTIMLITGFWLAMTGLLVVREVYPESTRLNAVPVGYVGQVVFQHEQASDLRILASGKEIGFLHIQPKTFASTGKRAIDFHGSLNLTLSGKPAQHISWVGVSELSHEFVLERLHLDLATPEPGQHLDVVIDLAGKRAAFGAKVGKEIVNETAFSLDEAGFGKLMSQAGVDPMMMRQLKASQGEMPRMEFDAQSSSIVISGQKLSTFLLILKAGGQTVFEAQLSQLGQVLMAGAPMLGWKLTPFNLPR
jgi:hypothetical protein